MDTYTLNAKFIPNVYLNNLNEFLLSKKIRLIMHQGNYHACEHHVPFLRGPTNIQCQLYGHNCSDEAAKTIYLVNNTKQLKHKESSEKHANVIAILNKHKYINISKEA